MAYKVRAGETQHAARERIAREKGFRSYRAYRQAGARERERATERLAARRPSYRRSNVAQIRSRARADVRAGGRRILTTRDWRRARAAIAGLPDHAEIALRADLELVSGSGAGTGDFRTITARISRDELDTSSVGSFEASVRRILEQELERKERSPRWGRHRAGWRIHGPITYVMPAAAAAPASRRSRRSRRAA